MAMLDVVQVGHPALRKKAESVTADQIRAVASQQLIDDMVETMHAAKGVGLAAPQVDANIRLFVAEAHPSKRRPHIQDLELLVVFNPMIEVVDETLDVDWEGCLSIDLGKMWGTVKRSSRIRLSGLDRAGMPIIRELEGFHARIAQHEADHLDGILFFDRIYERAERPEEVVIATLENYERFFQPQDSSAGQL